MRRYFFGKRWRSRITAPRFHTSLIRRQLGSQGFDLALLPVNRIAQFLTCTLEIRNAELDAFYSGAIHLGKSSTARECVSANGMWFSATGTMPGTRE